MTEWFLKIIGASDEIRAHLDQATLQFERPLVWWLGLAMLVPLGWFIYRRQRNNLSTIPPRLRWALTATRIVILLVLFFVLSGPYLKLDQQIEKRPIVALVFDQSQSMSLAAGPFESDEELIRLAAAAGYPTPEGKIDAETRKLLNQVGRAKLVQQVVQFGSGNWLTGLSNKYDVRFYSLAEGLTRLNVASAKPEIPEPQANGSETRLGDGLTNLYEEAAGRQIGGVVLFSDGQNTAGSSPVEAARAAANLGAPIFAVPAGSARPLRDLSLVDVFAPDLVSVGDRVNVSVTMEVQGYPEQPVQVILREEGATEPLDTKDLVLRSTEQQHVDLAFEARTSGAKTLSVELRPTTEVPEDLVENNTDSVVVKISDEKLRVLYVEGQARWDFRFLKNAMRRDHGLGGRGLARGTTAASATAASTTAETPAAAPADPAAVAAASPAAASGVTLNSETTIEPDIMLESEVRRRLPTERPLLPSTLDELAKYHVLILGDVSPQLLDSAFIELLAQAVRERGLGLVVAAGPQFMPHAYDERFTDLLPVRTRAGAAGIEAPSFKPFRLEVSADGAIHESMRLHDDHGKNENVWGQMPPYYWCAAAERPSPAATVLAYNPTIEGRFGKVPIVAHHYAGQGRVMFIGTDSTWLWRQNVGERFFYKFWGQTIRFVARRGSDDVNKKSWIEVRPVRARPGEAAQLELMAYSADGSPRRDKTLKIRAEREGAGAEAIEMSADPATVGRFTGIFRAKETGSYRFVHEPGGGLDPVDARLHVAAATEELRRPNVDPVALGQLGTLVALDQLGSIPSQLKGQPTLTPLYREAAIWDNWLVLSLLILVYCLDVGLRRLAGLS